MTADSQRPGLELLSEHGCFRGRQYFYRHTSAQIGLPMRVALFIPPRVPDESLALLVYLAGLTCTEETFTIKAGAQRLAAELGIALLMPDTSPRGANVAGESDSWDFGVGAGFYLDATREPWAKHWRMESYLMQELLPLAVESFGIDASRIGIFGHSMGGHGALTLALRHPHRFASVSAFAPIAAPTQAPWGKKAFSGYFGDDAERWAQHDASILMSRQAKPPFTQGLLIDQGLADPFLNEQLYPATFEAACRDVGQPLTFRYHEGYDHGYYFISTFIEDHLRFHHARLKRG
ncbi:MAG: S-formylglutathione hydrolase [Burkholderiaceae bacterium]|nr:S-formylglutathione hydrolase [Burkholderiaceae bacterium]